MCIVVTAFVLNDNDIGQGGKEIPICCVIVGKMVKVSRDSYSRVCKEDESHHYQKKMQDNLLR